MTVTAIRNKVKPDTVLKNFWRDNQRFADVFNTVLFNGKQVLKPEDLKEADTDISSRCCQKNCGWNRLYHLEFRESGKNSLCHATPAHDSRCINLSQRI